jgi:hypothetical protein
LKLFPLYLLLFSFNLSLAHSDFTLERKFGRTTVRIETGYQYAEIEKVFIYGQLVEKLSNSLHYRGEILLDFSHHYISDCSPDYFISFDGGTSYELVKNSIKEINSLDKKAIVIRQVSKYFDAETTLKLVEYAIKNIDLIKTTQSVLNYKQNFCDWTINSIDTLLISKVIEKDASDQVHNVMKTKIERINPKFRSGLSFFWQNDNYFIFFRDLEFDPDAEELFFSTDTVLLTLKHLNSFQDFYNSEAFIFDTDSSFYYVKSNGSISVSSRQIIKNTYDYFRPIRAVDMGGGKFSFHMVHYPSLSHSREENTLIYLTEQDSIIQDFDQLILKK